MINLIGINGYIGSGKDTVGQIIQYLTTDKKTISYSGSYNSYIMDLGMGGSITSPWEIKKFAAKLKQIASLLTGIPAEKFEDQEFKKQNMSKEWWSTWCNEGGMAMTYRTFLQMLGTEAIRDHIHEDAWVNALFADYHIDTPLNTYLYATEKHENRTATKDRAISLKEIMEWVDDSGGFPKWIITDVRFPNEAQAIVDKGGKMVRINRHEVNKDYQEKVKKHSSETSLDTWKFDWTINNNGSIEDLTELVKRMLIGFNIIS